MKKHLFTTSTLFGLVLLSSTFFFCSACKKEYSCEECQVCSLDTNIDIKDTAWRFNIGSKLYYGNLQYSEFSDDSTMFGFAGHAQHAPGAVFGFTLRLAPSVFNQNYQNLKVDNIVAHYGNDGTYIDDPDGAFDNKPQGLKGIIKSFDLINKTAEGSFCGTVLDTLGNDVKITNGRFKVKLP